MSDRMVQCKVCKKTPTFTCDELCMDCRHELRLKDKKNKPLTVQPPPDSER